MKPRPFAYAAPASLREALELLAAAGDGAQLLAGGQSLVPMLNARLAAPELLIDLNRVPELAGLVRLPDGAVRAGAMTRHRAFEQSALVREALPVIHAAMPHVAHVGIRNRGTIGGSLALADPAAEWPALALACDARIELASLRGHRGLPAAEFARGTFATAREPDEILTAVTFPPWPPGRRWSFLETARRLGDFAIVGVVCLLDLTGDGRCSAARIVVFGAADRPVLLNEAAACLIGRHPAVADIEAASRLADAGLEPMSDLHGSAEYRRQLARTLVRRALGDALALDTAAAA